ncbi:MAG: response regulator [Rhodomicrobium sp.]|nr:MAG: response regulator [Rhodomicrobium sp.]
MIMAHILLAEDDLAVRDFTYRALQLDGHAVMTAHEGQEALRCLTVPGDCFQLLISDIRMPIIDGVTLARLSYRQQPDLPVLLMTGYSDVKPEEFPPCVIGFLQKPFSLDDIRDAVGSALRHAPMRSRIAGLC